MVKLQARLIDSLGIDKLFAVIGGSMGGMQTLEWASKFENKVNAVVPIASSYRHSAQNIAFHEIGRQAIMADTNWKSGNYYKNKQKPKEVWLSQEWLRILPISQNQHYKENLVEIYKIVMIFHLIS